MHHLKQRQPDCPGVISATRGNHGQSIAVSATHQGLRSVICVPEGNNPEKNAAMIAQGAELVIHGRDFQESLEHARRLAAALLQERRCQPAFIRIRAASRVYGQSRIRATRCSRRSSDAKCSVHQGHESCRACLADGTTMNRFASLLSSWKRGTPTAYQWAPICRRARLP